MDTAYQFGRGVTDPFCVQDHVIIQSTDRRLLWHLEMSLRDAPMGSDLRRAGRALALYLHVTCDHHWHEYAGCDQIAAHRQCLWCHDVEWAEGGGAS